jgi:hypothetical protein
VEYWDLSGCESWFSWSLFFIARHGMYVGAMNVCSLPVKSVAFWLIWFRKAPRMNIKSARDYLERFGFASF